MNIKEEDLCYNEEEITSTNNEELEKFKKVEDDAKEVKDLVVMEEEPTYPKSHDTIKDEVLKTIPKVAPWGDMHKELKNEEVTPMSKMEEYIIQWSKEWSTLFI